MCCPGVDPRGDRPPVSRLLACFLLRAKAPERGFQDTISHPRASLRRPLSRTDWESVTHECVVRI